MADPISTETLAEFAAYAPERARRLSEEDLARPIVEQTFHSAVLMTDISGFTAMTERFENMGADGVERLTAALNDHFGAMIASIADHGGEIESHAGDAIIAFWPSDDQAGYLRGVTRAAQCALKLGAMIREAAAIEGAPLEAHTALVCGEVSASHIDGGQGRRHFMLTGKSLDRLATLIDVAGPGETVVDEAVTGVLGPAARSEAMPGGAARLLEVHAPSVDDVRAQAPGGSPPPQIVEYAPAPVARRLLAGQQDWLAEMRRLTAVFVRLSGEGWTANAEDALSMAVAADEIVGAHDGSVLSLAMGDKGATIYAVFGLPTQSHSDDAVRAVAAAREMTLRLGRGGHRVSVGVATGPTFCGVIGRDTWRTYSARGTVVNRAARIAGVGDGRVLCDDATRTAIADRFGAADAEARRFKGIEGEVALFEPRLLPVGGGLRDGGAHCVGRDEEIDRLTSLSAAHAAQPSATLIVIEGEPGMGKSTLLERTLQHMDGAGVGILTGAGDPIRKSAPFGLWRRALCEILGVSPTAPAAEVQVAATARLANDDALAKRLPLLSGILPFEAPDNEFTGQLEGDVRADNISSLLVSLIGDHARSGPTAMIIDDAQWVDNASWRLMRALAADGVPLLTVIATRPPADPIDPSYAAIAAGAERMALGEIAPEAIAALYADVFGARDVAPEIEDFILTRAAGNPFFARELSNALLDGGHVRRRDDHVDLVTPLSELTSDAFPATIEQVIVSRIDQLDTESQLTLKVASVIGRSFDFPSLRGVHPLADDESALRGEVDFLAQREFTPLAADDPNILYLFKHVITHQIAYELLTFDQRRRLHTAIAEWIETDLGDQRALQGAVLAHHWSAAARPERALPYLELDAARAVKNGAYPEAKDGLAKALAALDEVGDGDLGGEARPVRRGRMLRLLSLSHFRMGEQEDAASRLQEALQALGAHWPDSKLGYGGALIRELGAQAGRRWRGLKPDDAKPIDRRQLEISLAMTQLSQIYFFSGRLNEMALAIVSDINAAERSNVRQRIGLGYLTFGRLLNFAGMPKWAEHYFSNFSSVAGGAPQDVDLGLAMQMHAMEHMSQGDWGEAEKKLSSGLRLASDTLDRRRETELVGFESHLAYRIGDLDAARASAEVYLRGAEDAKDPQLISLSNNQHGLNEIWAENLDAAGAAYDLALAHYQDALDVDVLTIFGAAALYHRRRGDEPRARELALEALVRMRRAAPFAYYAIDSYQAVCEIFIDDVAAGVGGGESAKNARDAVAAFAKLAKKSASTAPRALLMAGRLKAAGGKPDRALEAFRAGRDDAIRIKSPYDIALSDYLVGSLGDVAQDERRRRLAEAESAFAAKRYGYEARRARTAAAAL